MSKRSVVTPYQDVDHENAEIVEACLDALIDGVQSVRSLLSRETKIEKQAIDRAKEQARHDRLHTSARQNISELIPERPITRALSLKQAKTLKAAVTKANFVEIKHPQFVQSNALHLFRSPTGENLVMQEKAGRVFLHSSKAETIHRVVRQHTLIRVAEHMTKRGLQVETEDTLAGVEIVAREVTDAFGDGRAVVGISASADGRLCVDIDGVESERCADIVNGIAESVDGKVTLEKSKDQRRKRHIRQLQQVGR